MGTEAKRLSPISTLFLKPLPRHRCAAIFQVLLKATGHASIASLEDHRSLFVVFYCDKEQVMCFCLHLQPEQCPAQGEH